MQGLLQKYEGNLEKALTGYNWGQGNLDAKLLEKYQKGQQLKLEELNAETKSYIKDVYDRLHLGRPPEIIPYSGDKQSKERQNVSMNSQFNPTINVRVFAPTGFNAEVQTQQLATLG